MAKLVTLATLLEDVRALYEIKSVSLNDTVLTRWINRSLALLHDHILSVAPDYFIAHYNLTVTSGTDEYDMSSLVTDFYRGRGASVLLESGSYSPLKTFIWEERHNYSNTCTSQADQLYRYMGKYLYLAPMPAWSGTIRLHYVPVATVLTASPANSVDLFNSWEEFIIVDVALKCALKEEAPCKDLKERRVELLQTIRSMAPQRDYSHNDRIRDVEDDRSWDPFSRLPWPT